MIRYALLLCGAIMVSHNSRAQTAPTATRADSIMQCDFSLLKSSNAWLTAPNAAGLTQWKGGHITSARLSLVSQDGGFADYYEAPKAFTLKAEVESFYQLSPRISLYGRMAYDNVAARHAGGSFFFAPQHMPFDIVEDSLTNTGRKHTDIYQLTGAISGTLPKGIAIGAKVELTAANYAKYKDLRHKNNVLDLTATAGLLVPVGSILNVGGHFAYRRNTENVRFATYGNSDKVYKSLVNYGAFIGKIEQFGENGYTDQNREMPFLSEHTGGGIQTELHFSPTLALYNAFDFAYQKGYYGKKSSYTLSYNQHKGHEYGYQGRLTWQASGATHHLTAQLSIDNLTDYGNSYRADVDKTTGASHYNYYSPLKLSNKVWIDLTIAYRGAYGRTPHLPLLDVTVGMHQWQRKQTAYVYPYFRRQHIRQNEWFAQGAYNASLKGGILTPAVAFVYSKGSGKPFTDGTFATPSDRQSPPPQMETYLMREYLCHTTPQYSLRLSMRYAFLLHHTAMKIYAEGGWQLHKANTHDNFLDARQRRMLWFTVGCQF